jgi:hypothetical protein
MATGGQFELAQAELDAVMNIPTNTPESMQLAGTLALCQSFLASTTSRPADMDAPLEMTAELAVRTGEGNAYWLSFGQYAVEHWRISVAREIGDHEQAVRTAETLRPDVYADRLRETRYWVNYGIALSRLRRRTDAVLAFRRAETISPHHVHRDPFVRESLAGLLTRVPRESPTARVLRRMATALVYRCSPIEW